MEALMKFPFKSGKVFRSGAIYRVGEGACDAASRDKSLHYEKFTGFVRKKS
jgi:hypothetical protein